MNPHRFIYIDAPGIASLYGQLHGEDLVETLLTMEHSRSSGWKMALNAFLGGSGESGKATKEARASRIVLRPENMLHEIVASLRAHGTLHLSIRDAIARTASTREPAWFEARHPFSVPPKLHEYNKMRAIIFVSGFQPYMETSPATPRISMSASLHHFPSAHDGQLSASGHDALFFASLNGQPHPYSVFGSIFPCGDGFQIKPYGIHL